MKKSFMTRVLAVALSAAMAFSMSTATAITANAATKGNSSLYIKPAEKVITAGERGVWRLAGSQVSKWTIKNAHITAEESVAVLNGVTKKAMGIDTKAAGEFKLFARVQCNKGASKGKEKVLYTAITVEDAVAEVAKIDTVKQTKYNEVVVTLTAEVDKVTLADFKVTKDESNLVNIVKSVSLAKDKKTVTLVCYTGMTDGKSYTVTYTATDADKTVSTGTFTATDGVVTDLAVTPTTITKGVATEIKFQTIDVNGVVVAEDSVAKKPNNLDITSVIYLNHGNEDKSTGKLTLTDVGDYATYTLTYHTYKYENGLEVGKITKECVVTAVADTDIAEYQYHISTQNVKPDWSKITPNHQVVLDDANNYIWFRFLDENGKEKTAEYNVTIGQASVVNVPAGYTTTSIVGKTFKGTNLGTAYVILTTTDKNEVVASLPVNVVAKRTLASFSIDPSNVTIISGSSVTTGLVKFKAVDQYGAPYTKYTIAAPVNTTAAAKTTDDNGSTSTLCPAAAGCGATGAAIAGVFVKANANTWKIVVKDTVTNVEYTYFYTVTVVDSTKAPASQKQYSIQFNGAELYSKTEDITAKYDAATAKSNLGTHAINVAPVELYNGVVSGDAVSGGQISIIGIEVKDPAGKTIMKVTSGTAAQGEGQITVSCDAIASSAALKTAVGVSGEDGHFTITAATGSGADNAANIYKRQLAAGSYAVIYTYLLNGTQTYQITGNVVIEDTTGTIDACAATLDGAGTKTLDQMLLKDNVTYTYAGTNLSTRETPVNANPTCTAKSINNAATNNGGTTYQVVMNNITVAANIAGLGQFATEATPAFVAFTGVSIYSNANEGFTQNTNAFYNVTSNN